MTTVIHGRPLERMTNRIMVSCLMLLVSSSTVTELLAQASPRAPDRVGVPLKLGALDRVNSSLLGGPTVAIQIERTGSVRDPLRLRVVLRSLPGKGQLTAPSAVFEFDGDGTTLYSSGPVSGVRRIDDPSSPSPVANDAYVLPLARSEAEALILATNLELRARGKRVQVDGGKLPQTRTLLQSLLAAADAGLPLPSTPSESSPGATTSATSSYSQSNAVIVLQSRVTGGSGSALNRPMDSSAKRVLGSTSCGTARLCAQGWDLRVVRIAVDDNVFAPGGFLQGHLAIENRGAAASEISEVRLCVSSGIQCVGEPATVSVPVLASGERLDLSQPIPAYGGRDVAPPYGVLAVIDPDKVTGESNRSNNEAVIRGVTLDTAALAVDVFEVPASLRDGASQLQAAVTIRNASRVASSPARSIQLGGWCGGYRTDWGDIATRVQIPPLGPSQSWSATLAIRHSGALKTSYPTCELRLTLLQSNRPEEQEMPERRLVRPYKIERSR